MLPNSTWSNHDIFVDSACDTDITTDLSLKLFDSFTATGPESDPCFCHGVFAVMRPLNLRAYGKHWEASPLCAGSLWEISPRRWWLFQFSLNDFLWIQWIMKKSKSDMVTRGITHLATHSLLVLVIQRVFSLLPLGIYCHSPDTNLQIVVENSFLPIHQGM